MAYLRIIITNILSSAIINIGLVLVKKSINFHKKSIIFCRIKFSKLKGYGEKTPLPMLVGIFAFP